MLLGDFNTKVGWENIFKPAIQNSRLYETSSDNEVRVVNFATSKNLIFKSTMFPHYSIYKYTRTYPDAKIHIQIDPVLIDKRCHSNLVCV